MIRRHVIAVGLATFGVLALASCSVPVTGGTGLLVDGGRVQAVVQMCPNTTASEVRLTKSFGSTYPWERVTWRFDSAEYATVDLGTVDEFLERVGDRRMEISSNSSAGEGGWVEFDAESIGALGEGEIISYSSADNDSKIFDIVSFEDESLMYCPAR